MAYHSLLTVAGKYITNTLEAYSNEKIIDFWINPYHQQEIVNIKCGDIVGVFLMGVGLMYVGEVVQEPYIDSKQYIGVAKKAKIDEVFNAYNSRKELQSIGLIDPALIDDLTKLVNDAFASKRILISSDSILNLCLRPVGLSGKYQNGRGTSIGSDNGKETSIGSYRFKNPTNGRTIVSLYARQE